jgi:hypothetical protein
MEPYKYEYLSLEVRHNMVVQFDAAIASAPDSQRSMNRKDQGGIVQCASLRITPFDYDAFVRLFLAN